MNQTNITEFKERVRRKYISAKRIMITSIIMTCVFIPLSIFAYFDIETKDNLSVYNGVASNLVEKSRRYGSDYIEFTLVNQTFNYSGAFQKHVKTIINNKATIEVLAESPSKTKSSINVYAIYTNSNPIFTYQQSVDEHKREGLLLIILGSVFFIVLSYCSYKEYKNVLKPKL